MGDVVSLVEQAQQAVDAESAAQIQQKMMSDRFTLEDLLVQMRQMKKLGPVEKLLEMLPGVGALPPEARAQFQGRPEQELKRTEAIILSMTPMERRHPERLDGRRRARIARGSGTTPADVNDLLRQFDRMKQMMKQLHRHQKRLPRAPM